MSFTVPTYITICREDGTYFVLESGRTANLDNSREGSTVLALGASRGYFDIVFSHLSFLFFRRRPDID